jgi:hypothetical protein
MQRLHPRWQWGRRRDSARRLEDGCEAKAP